MTTVTPYAASKLANVKFEAAGLKKVPSQMLYNYTTARINAGKATLIPTQMVDGKVHINTSDLEVWVTSYINKKLARTPREEVNPYSQQHQLSH